VNQTHSSPGAKFDAWGVSRESGELCYHWRLLAPLGPCARVTAALPMMVNTWASVGMDELVEWLKW
jgi:hypothetical protein